MAPGSLAILLTIAAFAAYTQTLTGFALGLIMMGGVGLSGVIALPDAAVLVSILVIVNAVQVLAKGWRVGSAGHSGRDAGHLGGQALSATAVAARHASPCLSSAVSLRSFAGGTRHSEARGRARVSSVWTSAKGASNGRQL